MSEISINSSSQNQNSNEFSLLDFIDKIKQYYKILKFNFKVLLLSLFIGLLIGYIYSVIEKPIYKAELTFALDDDKGSVGTGGMSGGALGIASSLGIDLGSSGGGAFAATNLIELMKSKLIIENSLLSSVIINNKKTTLINFYIEVNNLKNEWRKDDILFNINYPNNISRSQMTRIQDSIIKDIYQIIKKENLTIYQKDKKVTIISVNVTSENELFSKYFCEALTSQVSKFYIETKSKKARFNVELLQKQTDSIRNELGITILGMANENDNIYNLNPASNYKGAPSRKKQIEIQANTAILTQALAQLEIAKVTLRKETPLIQYIDTPILPLDKYEIKPWIASVVGAIMLLFIFSAVILIKNSFKKINVN